MAHTCELAEPSTAGAHGVAHEERTTEPFEWRAWRDVEEGSLAAPQTDNVAPTDTSHHPLALPPHVCLFRNTTSTYVCGHMAACLT